MVTGTRGYHRLVLVPLSMLLVACSLFTEAPPDATIVDLDVQDVLLTIGGRSLSAYGYNGTVPGPLLHAEQGGMMNLTVRNDLSMPVSMRWHGVNVSADSPAVIAPGDAGRYVLSFPEEGFAWYADAQLDGLYGGIIVARDAADGPQRVLFLDDPEDFGEMPGRPVRTVLVNGGNDTFEVSAGTPVRMHIVNVADNRTFNLTFKKARVLLAGEPDTTAGYGISVILPPGESVAVDVTYVEPGAFSIRNTDIVDMAGQDIAMVRVGNAPGNTREDES